MEALIGLDRIRNAAKRDKALRFTNLMHHITVDLLRDGYHALKRDAASGVDDVSWRKYVSNWRSDCWASMSVCKVADIELSPQSESGYPKPTGGNVQLA